MKFLIIILFFTFTIYIVPQDILALELCTHTKNYPSQGNRTVTFMMQNVGDLVWAQEEYFLPHILTDNYQLAQEQIGGNGNHTGAFKGFNQCWHDQG